MNAMSDRIWVLVPMKCFSRAKGRLAPALPPATRRALARAMADDVVAALYEAGIGERLCVLSDSPEVHEFAAHRGLAWYDDARVAARPGLNAGIAGVAREAGAGGATALLIVHADLPLLTADAIGQVVRGWRALSGTGRVALARSGDGGTNMLLVERPRDFTYRFGTGSHALHMGECARRGRSVASLTLAPAALDIDTPGDLARLERAAACNSGNWSQSARARACASDGARPAMAA